MIFIAVLCVFAEARGDLFGYCWCFFAFNRSLGQFGCG